MGIWDERLRIAPDFSFWARSLFLLSGRAASRVTLSCELRRLAVVSFLGGI